jgi:PKD repeat protein
MIPAWSFNGRKVNPDDLPPAMEWMISEYVRQIAMQDDLGKRQQQNQLPDQQWHTNIATTAGVTPLVTTSWDQRCFYNDSCPVDPLAPAYYCGKAPAGCVATTFAQILRYHKWPLQGTGSKSYYSIKYGTLSANFGATAYAMAAMPTEIFATNPEVAQLLWHAGVATQMNFGPYASGTGITDARTALITYFGYKSSAQIVTKNNYADAAWKTLMCAEIDQGRPVFYSGVDPTSNTGHAWVLDGYSGTDYFHFNWGWSGIADGYFLLTALDPLGSANYVNFQEAIIGIEPQGAVPLAAFSADVTTISTGDPVLFSNLSTGGVTQWQWFFEGGTPAFWSGASPPLVTWSTGGIRDVMLVVSNGSSTDTLLKKSYIRVLPIAGYTVSQPATEAGQSVVYSDNSESNTPLISWKWQFPGGNPGNFNGKNPGIVQYAMAGQYPVILEVSDGIHQDRRVFQKAVTVYNQCDTLLDHFMPGWSVQPINQPTFQIHKEDLDGLTPYHQAYISSGWDYFSEGGGANHFVSATSLFQTPGQANNWYIFGPVSIPAGGATLQWRHKFPDHTKRDGYQVKLSTTGHTHQQFSGSPIFAVYDNDPYTLGDTAWTLREAMIDRTAFGNQQVYVGVHHYANNMFYLGLDDFMIFHCDTFPHQAGFWTFDTVITAGDTITIYDLSTGKPDQVQWSLPGATIISSDQYSQTVTYPTPGNYDVSQTVWYGMASNILTKPAYIQVKPIGIESKHHNKNTVSISPNPFSHQVTIRTTNTPTSYTICDTKGTVAKKALIDQNSFNPEWSSLPPGVWILLIHFEDGSEAQRKLIKY